MRHKEPEEPKPESSPDTPLQEPKEKKGEVDELRSAIESLQKEKDDLFGKLQRVSADYVNFQKRVPKQIADTVGYEKERIIRALLPVLDNFEHTLQSAASAENVEALVKGVRIIYDQFLDILKIHEVEQIGTLGEKFDPSVHEAMTHQANPEKEDGVVLEEFQKGYKLSGRVIRPSRVVVNKLPAPQIEQPSTPAQPCARRRPERGEGPSSTPADSSPAEPRERAAGERQAAEECETTDTE